MGQSTRSEALLARSQERLDASARVRFVVEASAGRLADRHFARYLAIEEGFVKTAVRVNAFCLWKEPDWASVGIHATTIANLLGEQLDYFDDVRRRHPDSPEALARAVHDSRVLSDFVTSALETHGYAAALVSMFAAETLYARWCRDAAATRVADPTSDVDSWIRLHTAPAFLEQAATLAMLVDRLPDDVNDADLDVWFSGMLAAEDAFHDSIYEDSE